MKTVWTNFKTFALQGDLVSVAVALVIGLAFKALVESIVNDIVMPLVGAIFGKPSFDDLTLTLGKGVIQYGLFINSVLNFLIIAVTLFVVVEAYEKLRIFRSAEDQAGAPTELELLTEIRDLLRQRDQ